METQRILDALVVVKLLPTLKHVINIKSQKKVYYECVWNWCTGFVFTFFFFSSLGAGLLISFHGNSCPFDHFHSAANMRSEWSRARMREWCFLMPRGLVHVAGSERCVLSHLDSPPSQTILEIRIRRGGISIQGPAVWAIPCSPHFYMMHGCGSLPSATDGNPHTQLPQRLAHSDPIWTKDQTRCQGTMSLQRNRCPTRSRSREFGKSLARLE